MSRSSDRTIDVFGEGKTDIGDDAPQGHVRGVVPILLHFLCGRPDHMRVRTQRIPFLAGKGMWQKAKLAKRRARYAGAAGAVFVVDSEGGPRELKRMRAELEKGRDDVLPEFPMAVGVAHPCIEAWLLADARAIQRGLGLPQTPEVPDAPERLPAPRHDRDRSPKGVLTRIAAPRKGRLSVADTDRIAAAMTDMGLVRSRCPQGFAPFADEVDQRIRPLFA